MILRFSGISAISGFKAKQLLSQLKKANPDITNISAEYIHLAEIKAPLTADQKSTLASLLTYDTPYQAAREGQLLVVTPRPGTISPWSSKATSIVQNSGLPVKRVERATAYYIDTKKPIKLETIADLLHDRMVETVLTNLADSEVLFKSAKPRPLVRVDIKNGQKAALVAANKEMGLALSDEEIDYLYEQYIKIDRNPTDLELMMFGVVNSEHCRHKIFNADWYIDNQKQPKSLFKMIKNTYQNHSEDVISAYSDNAAILEGHQAEQLSPTAKGAYQTKKEKNHLVIKVETHNHPTAIAPFPGAATGSGGEIRDENATGRGAKPKMGLTGFSVSNLNIPGFTQPWEVNTDKPERIASPLEIMVKGPLGGAAFNNEFGRPNTVGYFRTYETADTDKRWGYHKPIMIAGGVGSIKDGSKDKKHLQPGNHLVVIGGPAMLIGLAGGAASSMESGKSDAELDFASVQRGNAEIQRRAHEVIARCTELGPKNPIISIHDVGAGGLSNALTELVNDSGLGATFELRDIDNADPALSPMEIWCNEAQERYVMAIDTEDLERFKKICEGERCPYSVVGTTTEEPQLIITDSLFDNQPANIPMSLLFGSPPKITKRVKSATTQLSAFDVTKIPVKEAVERVLQIPSVGSKKFLITIGDRNVGGLTARDQMIGPWQVPVSDCAVSATSFFAKTGEAMAMGERTPLAIINAPASARIAIAEAITNIAAAQIDKLSDIKLSANWMAASGYQNEDYNLFQTVKTVGEEFCPQLNLTIPVGKDSLSMRTIWQDQKQAKSVASPVSLIVSAFAPVSNINTTITPRLLQDTKTTLIFIDLADGKTRLGGSALAQAYAQVGNESPDVDEPLIIKKFFETIQTLRNQQLIKAYHDRSDGGILTTVLEMAFAGRVGLDLDLNKLPGTTLAKLFNEEIGAIIQVKDSDLSAIEKILEAASLKNYRLGSINTKQAITIKDKGKVVFADTRAKLEKLWSATSHQIQTLRDNAECAYQEHQLIEDDNDPGINPKFSFSLKPTTYKTRPKVAILREQGVNGQNEMAAAFYMAGFDPVDVPMQALQTGQIKLNDFVGLAVCGGFSYGDVLGAGQGWAKGILYSPALKQQFSDFFARDNTFSLGICNGCQMLAGLKELIPGAEAWPTFLKNKSEQFEARFVSVKINKTNSIFFKDMEGSILSVPTAHGEGRAVFKNKNDQKTARQEQIVAQFVDNKHQSTETYPLNPNGSEAGITALTSADGRALIMMPHPERSFLTYQNSWHPDDWGPQGPWLKIFQNARDWVGEI